MTRLALGTAQFGLAYGIANTGGQISLHEAAKILTCARDGGVDTLDTAIAYGESESRLGELGVTDWRVVSKLPELPLDCHDVCRWVKEHVVASLRRLRIPRLHGLLLHRSESLLTPDGARLHAAMVGLQADGLVFKTGVSIYDPAELDALEGRFPVELVQAPFNPIDRRLETSGWLRRLKARDVELHTRSTFLQGLLLLPAARRPAKFHRWASLWSAWDGWLEAAGLDPIQGCLGFVLRYPEIDRVVVGVDSAAHLAQLLAVDAAQAAVPPQLSSEDLDLINPSKWSSL